MGYLANLGRALFGPLFTKASAVGPMVAQMLLGRPVWPKRDYEQLGKEGYQQNPVVFACVQLISKSLADIPWVLYEGEGDNRTEIEEHPLLDLMKQPNPMQDRAAFLQAVVSYFLITGNSFIERTAEDKFERMELYALPPQRTQVVPGETGLPMAYVYS